MEGLKALGVVKNEGGETRVVVFSETESEEGAIDLNLGTSINWSNPDQLLLLLL